MKKYFSVVKKTVVKVDDVEHVQFVDSNGILCRTFDAINNNQNVTLKVNSKDKYYKAACKMIGVVPEKGVGKPALIDIEKRAACMAIAEFMIGGSDTVSEESIPKLLQTRFPQYNVTRY